MTYIKPIVMSNPIIAKEELIDLYKIQLISKGEIGGIYQTSGSVIRRLINKYNIRLDKEELRLARERTMLIKYGVKSTKQLGSFFNRTHNITTNSLKYDLILLNDVISNISKKLKTAERSKNYYKIWRQNNLTHLKSYYKDYVKSNKTKIKQLGLHYVILNKAKIKKDNHSSYLIRKSLGEIKPPNRIKKQKYHKNRLKTDSVYRCRSAIGACIRSAIKRNGYTKKSKCLTILGCSFSEFKSYIESKFTKGMTWLNHGEWHLDHIIPISSAQTEAEVIKLNHYSNFQPLWAVDNYIKSNKTVI